jgi:hypothetical protein
MNVAWPKDYRANGQVGPGHLPGLARRCWRWASMIYWEARDQYRDRTRPAARWIGPAAGAGGELAAAAAARHRALAFAAVAFAWPHLTLFTLTFLWGAYALSDGIFALWAAVSGEAGGLAPRWWLAVVGIARILAGLLTFFWPGMIGLLLMIFIAGWAIEVVLQKIGRELRYHERVAHADRLDMLEQHHPQDVHGLRVDL